MAALLLHLNIFREASIKNSTNGVPTGSTQLSTNGLHAEFMLTPDDDIQLGRELGWVRLSIDADAEHLPQLTPTAMEEWLRVSLVKMLQSKGMTGGNGA